jgi:TPR repeat protein
MEGTMPTRLLLPLLKLKPSLARTLWTWAPLFMSLGAVPASRAGAAAHEAPSTGHSAEQVYSLAVEAQTERRYGEMLALLRQAAAAGHLEAQERLGVALLGGKNLYGVQLPGNRCEAHEWFLRAARNGSDLAVFYVHLMNQTRNSPAGSKCWRNAERK